jgi:hypothetical protein
MASGFWESSNRQRLRTDRQTNLHAQDVERAERSLKANILASASQNRWWIWHRYWLA